MVEGCDGDGGAFAAATLWGLAGLCAAAVLATVGAHFDVTDEGNLLYLLASDAHPFFFSPFYALYHPLGGLFSHQLLAYRLLNAGVTAAACAFFAARAAETFGLRWGWRDRAPWTVVAACCALPPLLTPSYQHLAADATLLWLGTVFALLSSGRPASWRSPALAAAVLLGGLARPPLGVLLAAATGALAAAVPDFRRRVLWRVVALAALVAAAAAFLGARDYLGEMLRIAPLQARSSHPFGLSAAAHGVASGLRPAALPALAWLAWAAAVGARSKAGLRPAFSESGFPSVVLAASLAYAGTKVLLDGWRWEALAPLAVLVLARLLLLLEVPARQAALSALAVAVSLTYSAGSNTNLFAKALQNPALLIVTGLAVLRTRRAAERLPAYALLATMTLTLFQTTVLGYHRSGSLREQTHRADGIPRLAGLRVREDVGKALRGFLGALRARGIGSGRLIAYPDLPGFVAVSPLEAAGTAWYVRGYPGIDAVNCEYLRMGAAAPEGGPVYLLKGGEPTAEFAACLRETFVPVAEGYFSEPVGTFWDHRSEVSRTLELSGPLQPLKADRF